MSGKGIKFLKDRGGRPVGLRIDPQALTGEELLRITRTRVFSLSLEPRSCTIRTPTKTVFIEPDYLRDVSLLNRDARDRHIAATERTMEIAANVTILYGHSPEKR